MDWRIITFLVLFYVPGLIGEELFGQVPEEPVITYVTVDTTTNNINLFWIKSTSADVVRYDIYQEVKKANPWYEGDSLISVPASVNSCSINTSELTVNQPFLFSIAAVNSSGTKSTRTKMHGPVHNTVVYDSCINTLTLRWNKYQGWGPNIGGGYLVYQRIGSEGYRLLIGIDPKDSSYTIFDVPENIQYYFFIQAVKAGDTIKSLSNITAKNTYMPSPPEDLHLDHVSFSDPDKVEIKFSFTVPSIINSFALLRSNQEFSEFIQVDTFQNVTTSPHTVYNNILTSDDKYFYRIGVLNSCLIVIDTSNLGTNILLKGENIVLKDDPTENSKVTLEYNSIEWNIYREFPFGTDYYEIYRIDVTGNKTFLGQVGPGENSFTDTISYLENGDLIHKYFGPDYSGNVNYQVNAVEKGINKAFSNICKIDVRSDIWIPNAFTPNGDEKNDIFAPFFYFTPEDYLLLIYDRYGTVIFRSEDPKAGWDGRKNGNSYVPGGVYIYHVQYTSFNRQPGVRTGSVTVFYP